MKTYQVFKPKLNEKSIQNAVEVLTSGWIGLGPKTEEFETKFAEYVGAKHCIGLNSCTSALHLALEILDLKPGDEVISTPLTFVSTNHAILYAGCRPVFADVDAKTGCLDPYDVEKRITAKTKAIIVVHYGGCPADLDKFYEISRVYNIPLIEDCAHACGASYKGKRIGGPGLLQCFSFHAVKNLSMGDGGAITTNNTVYADKLKKLRWLGINKSTFNRTVNPDDQPDRYLWAYDVDEIGYKCVHALTRIKTDNKKSKRIMEIVNKKEKINVLSMDNTGKLVKNKITGWFKNEKGNRKWVHVSHEYARHKKGFKSSKEKYRGVFVTEDHPVLTNKGYKKAIDLKTSDYLITIHDDFLPEQRSFVLGTMLGDGSLVKHKKNPTQYPIFGITHGKKQKEWFNIKCKMLKNFSPKTYKQKNECFNMQTTSEAVFESIYYDFYYRNKKIVPKNFTSKDIDDRFLATWYLDDGVLNGNIAILCTDNFDNKSINKLKSCLEQKGYIVHINIHEKKYKRLAIQNANKSFFIKIAPYIPSSMRYKLPQKIEQKIPYNHKLWDMNCKVFPKLKSKVVKKIMEPKTRKNHIVYCIDVKNTHNFIVDDIVLHNCHMNDISAAIGLGQLETLDTDNLHRSKIAFIYQNAIKDLQKTQHYGIILPEYERSITSSFHFYPIRIKKRHKVIDELKKKGISPGVHYNRNDSYKMYEYDKSLKNVESFSSEEISLPIHMDITQEDAQYIISQFLEVIKTI